jgi:hypothetical protein
MGSWGVRGCPFTSSLAVQMILFISEAVNIYWSFAYMLWLRTFWLLFIRFHFCCPLSVIKPLAILSQPASTIFNYSVHTLKEIHCIALYTLLNKSINVKVILLFKPSIPASVHCTDL